MRIAGWVIAALLIAAPAFADDTVHYEQIADDAAVASTGSATTSGFDLRQFGTNEALFFQAVSVSGDADVKIEYALSLDNSTYTDFSDFTDLIASSLTTYASFPETLHRILLPVMPGRWVKFKVTGVSSNPADTTVDLWFAGRGVMR